MAFKKYILSDLFPGKQKLVPKAQEADAAEQAQPAAAQAAEAPDAAAHIPSLLVLPAGHAVHRLFELWVRQTGRRPPPRIQLDDPGILPEGWLAPEMERLEAAITAAAGARLDKLKPDGKAKTGEEPAPPPALDAEPWVFLSAGQLAAWMLVFPPMGGAELSRELLAKALEQNKIAFGVDGEMLEKLPEAPDCYFHLQLLAKGRPAVDGKDGKIVDFFARQVEKEIKADEFGQVDYTAISTIQNANKGDAICQLIPHTEGEPGMTVQGKDIPAKNGKKVTLPKGRNTEASEDGTKLLASQAGHVEFTGRTFQVKSVLDIPGNVDYSTGNINFLGDVHVRGDVCTGFFVRAVGSIRVDGVIEGAVEAGADLIVGKGILGGPQSIIRAHRNVFAKYMENSRVQARENLTADCIVNCDVYSDGVVQVCTGRGTIIGGRVSAGQGVSAKVVGSKAEGLTTILLGGLPCAEYERELLLREIGEMEEQLQKLENQPDGPAKLSRLSKTRMKISVNRMKLDQMDKDLAALHEALEGMGKARLECGIAYAGTEIFINGKSLRLNRETHKCVARLADDGEIRVF